MWKWIGRAVLLMVLVGGGYAANEYYSGGFHKLPPMPEGAFPLSFKNGFRAIMVGVEDLRSTRRYRGYPAKDVPDWYEETWSTCRSFSDEELKALERTSDFGPGHRWEAVCEIEAEGATLVRGWIASVPES